MHTMEITHRTGDYHGDGTNLLIWEIADDQGIAAALYVSVDRREVMNVETREDRRREGLASALYRAADAQAGIFHAPVAHRTEEGAAFAEAVGGETAVYACECYGCAWTDKEDEDRW